MIKISGFTILIILFGNNSVCYSQALAAYTLHLLSGVTAKHAIPLENIIESESLNAERKKQINNEYKLLSKQISNDPKNPDLYLKRALLAEQMGAYSTAKRDIDIAFSLGSTKRELYMVAGRVSYYLTYRQTAINYFSAILDYDSTDSQAYLQRGITKLYVSKSRFNSLKERCEESLPDFEKALQFNPSLVEAYLLYGYTNYKLERTDIAINTLSKALQVKPDRQTTIIMLGEIYLENKQTNEACALFADATNKEIEIPKNLRKACE